ncbi:MAG: dihydroneopterin aldolase [Chloroflexota bacterium]|nr:dihydroneopterin aldolase [Chloroflexota bacterium]
MSEDRLSLMGMRFHGRHGVLAEEKLHEQPFEVDVVLHADLREASESDELSATTDYSRVFDLVRDIVEGPPVALIETLAGRIAAAVLDATDPARVDSVEVRVRKPEAPLDGEFETVEAALVRRRPDRS